MIQEIDVLARLTAWGRRYGVLIRNTSSIAPDPPTTFGIAIIQLVGEQRIQAVAFGTMGGGEAPSVCLSTNPLDRDVAYLEPFAEALCKYVRGMLGQGLLPRIWIGTEASRECLALLGPRYGTNRKASELIRDLGRVCTALTLESEYAGQQVLIKCVKLLQEHIRTGQSPLQDYNLGALLAWLRPSLSLEPWVDANRRALEPSAAVLSDEEDERVEQQRTRARLARLSAGKWRTLAREAESDGTDEGINNTARTSGQKRGAAALLRSAAAEARASAAEAEIVQILTDAVRREYALLVEAHSTFWDLPLVPCPGVERLVEASSERLTALVASNGRDARATGEPHVLAMDLEAHEYAISLTDSIYVGGDSLIREQAYVQGRVVRGIVRDVQQPRSSRRPCNVIILTMQEVLRIRIGTQLRMRGTDGGPSSSGVQSNKGNDRALVGRVVGITEDEASGGTLIDLELTSGLRRAPSIGDEIDADDAVLFGGSYRARRIYQDMARTRPPLVYGDLPTPWPRNSLPKGNLLAVAARLRSKR